MVFFPRDGSVEVLINLPVAGDIFDDSLGITFIGFGINVETFCLKNMRETTLFTA